MHSRRHSTFAPLLLLSLFIARPALGELTLLARGEEVAIETPGAPQRALQFRVQAWQAHSAEQIAAQPARIELKPINDAWGKAPELHLISRDEECLVQRVTWTADNLSLLARYTHADGHVRVSGELFETQTGPPSASRLLTLMLTIPVPPTAGALWLRDAHTAEALSAADENLFTFASHAGSRGSISRYPFGAVASSGAGIAMGFPIDQPRIHRVRYDGPHGCLVAEIDVALSAVPLKFPGRVDFEFLLWDFPAQSGFRGALQAYYTFFGTTFGSRGPQGQWMPFTSIEQVRRPEDFRLAYHEYHPNISVAYDNRNGIHPLIYCEPSAQYIDMPAGVPRTPEAFLPLLNSLVSDKSSVVRSSGGRTADGSLITAFVDLPWANGARVPTNCDGEVRRSALNPMNAFDMNWKPYRDRMEIELKHAGKTDPEACGGLYLDSLEGWESPQLNFDPDQLKFTDFPLTFDAATGQVGQVLLLQDLEFVRDAAAMLKARGALLMANTALYRWCWPAAWLDVLGIETGWGTGTQITPPSIEEMDFIRALCGQRPYCYLQNVPFDKFRGQKVADYFARCLFYGFWPGFFSQDAANDPYWEDARLYDADRAHSLRYMEPEGMLTEAGWQPVTLASLSDPQVLIERWGGGPSQPEGIAPDAVFFSLLNPTDRPRAFVLRLDDGLWGGHIPLAFDLLDGYRLPGRDALRFTLKPNEALALYLLRDESLAIRRALQQHAERTRRLISKWKTHHMLNSADAAAAIDEVERIVEGHGSDHDLQSAREKLEPLYHFEFDRARRMLRMLAALPLEIKSGGALHPELDGVLSAHGSSQLRVSGASDNDELFVLTRSLDRVLTSSLVGGRAELKMPPGVPTTATLEIVVQAPSDAAPAPFMVLRAVPGDPVGLMGLPDRLVMAETGELELMLHNYTATALRGRLEAASSGGIACEPVAQDLTLDPGIDHPLKIKLSADTAQSSSADRLTTLSLVWHGAEVAPPVHAQLGVETLGVGANRLRLSSVQMLVDSTFFGYTQRPLTDGVTDTAGVEWSEAAWASEEGVQSHWVEFRFREPVMLQSVRLWWASDNGKLHTSSRVLIQGKAVAGDAWKDLAEHTEQAARPRSEIKFAPTSLARLRVLQPAGGGVRDRPNIMWLSEIEAD